MLTVIFENSLKIVKSLMGLIMIAGALYKLVFKVIPPYLFYCFFFIFGIYIGYFFAYYSIRHLRKRELANQLPKN